MFDKFLAVELEFEEFFWNIDILGTFSPLFDITIGYSRGSISFTDVYTNITF